MQISNINKAIILHLATETTHTTLFDHLHGKIQVYRPHDRSKYLLHGSLIQYVFKKNNTRNIADVVVKAMPASWVIQDLLFFHHVLEIASFFLAEAEPAPAVFEHFQLLYSEPSSADIHLFKKLFMCRLFTLLGIYPENAPTRHRDLFNLISRPINIMLNAQDDYAQRTGAITTWLLACIHTHPHAHRLQTINFLTHLDQHES